MNDTLTGRRVPTRGRRPISNKQGRACAKKGCQTILSRYNLRDYCFAHAPKRFPRVRGIVTKDKG